MKKVLILSSFPAPYRVAVFGELSKEYDVELYFGMGSNEDRSKDWYSKSESFSFQILDNKDSKLNFRKALWNIKKYDFVLAYDVNQIPGYKLIFTCRLNKVPYFVNCDGAILKRNLIKDLVKRYLFGKASGCFSSGKSATNYFLIYGVKRERIFEHRFTSLEESDILENVISPEEKSRKKDELGIKKLPTVISVGQFIHRKGFDVLLDAWRTLDDKYQLLLVGGGGLKSDYEKTINEYGLKNVIIYDFMKKDVLNEYYRASDLFVLPTREDIWGLVVNEAMANGLPVITTNNCVAGLELIENGVNGYLVDVDDAKSLSEKIDVVLSDDIKCREMGANGLSRIQGCTLKNIAVSHIATIGRVIG